MSVYKLNQDTYVGNTGKKLSDILTNANNIKNNTNNIAINTNKLYQVGLVIDSGIKTSTANQSQSNFIQTLNIPKGIWLVFGNWTYEGNQVSSYTSIEGINYNDATSCYDDAGWVNMTVIGLSNSDGSHVAKLNLWPRNKTISVKAHMWAIKIAN